MPVPKLTLLTMNLLIACLISACQTMPNGEAESALQTQPMTQELTQALETQPSEPAARITPEQLPEMSEQLQDLVETLPLEEPDLIGRMVEGFSLELPDEPRVTQELNWYRSHTSYIQRIQERAEPYLLSLIHI